MKRSGLFQSHANLFDVAVVVCCLLLQLVLGGHFSLFGAVPDFLLAGVFFLSLRHGRACGAIAGFALGLVFDLLGASTVGISALIATIFGFLAPTFSHFGSEVDPGRGALLFAAMSFVYNLVYFTFLLLLGDAPAVGLSAFGKVLASVIMDTAVAFFVLCAYRKVSSTRDAAIKL